MEGGEVFIQRRERSQRLTTRDQGEIRRKDIKSNNEVLQKKEGISGRKTTRTRKKRKREMTVQTRKDSQKF